MASARTEESAWYTIESTQDGLEKLEMSPKQKPLTSPARGSSSRCGKRLGRFLLGYVGFFLRATF